MPPTSLRVLVVDDIADNRETLGLLVRAWGHEVRLAQDGPSALEAFTAFRPHAVLLDIGRPGLDGWEVARRIRLHEVGAATLVIAVSGCSQERDRECSRQAGIDLHRTKPADPQLLHRLLAEANRQRHGVLPPRPDPWRDHQDGSSSRRQRGRSCVY
jgi:CheY-like chemotaxis protein